jgi:inorganic pyrophosphatase
MRYDSAHMTAIDRIDPFAENKDHVHVIIDTPRGSRNKLKRDRKLGVLKLSHILTAGAVFRRDLSLIEAEQTQDGKTIRNDRMVAVAVGSRLYAKVSDLDDLPATLMDEMEQFFINYNRMRGRVFKSIARRGAAEGRKLVKRSAAKVTKKNMR